MGVFSDDKKTVVSTTALHLMNAGADPVKDAILESVFKGTFQKDKQSFLPETIMAGTFNGMGVKMRAAMKYAEEDYQLGLPQGRSTNIGFVSEAEMAASIKDATAYAYDILVLEHAFTELTPLVSIYEFLIKTRGYDANTNKISVWPAGAVFTYFRGITGANKYIDVTEVRVAADGISADITYGLYVERWHSEGFRDDEGYWQSENVLAYEFDKYVYENVPIPNVGSLTFGEEVLIVVYKNLDAGGIPTGGLKVWTYELASGVYPDLDPTQNTDPDTFLPVVPIRYHNQDYTDASREETTLYKTSNTLLKKMGLDFKGFGDMINSNPNVGDIDHAYVMFGVDLQTENSQSIKYLVHFFDRLYQLQEVDEIGFNNGLTDPVIPDEPRNRFSTGWLQQTVPESFAEYGLSLGFWHSYITSDSITGVLGDGSIGNTSKTIGTYSYEVTTTEYDGGESGTYYDYTRTVTKRRLILKLQIAPNVIKQVIVHNPVLRNLIYDGKAITTTLAAVAADSNNHNFIIPVEYGLATDNFTISEQSTLFADTCIMVINSYDEIKTKWYESGFFKFLIIVVAVVITIWSGGATSWLTGLATAAAAGTMMLLEYLVLTFLVSLAISMATQWIVKQLGPKFAMIVAVVALIAAVYMGPAAPGAIEAGTGAVAETSMITSAHLIQASSALISATNEFLIEEAIEATDEYADFIDKLEERYGDLDELLEFLENKADVNPLTFAMPSRYRSIAGEEPAQFYQRCLGLPDNSMFVIHDEIPHFVTTRTQLQKRVPPGMIS